MRKISVAIALALSMFIATPVFAQDECQSFTRGLADVRGRFPDVTVKEYSGTDALKLISSYNNLEPISDVNGDHVYLVVNGGSAIFVVTKGDCIQASQSGPADKIFIFIEIALKNPSI